MSAEIPAPEMTAAELMSLFAAGNEPEQDPAEIVYMGAVPRGRVVSRTPNQPRASGNTAGDVHRQIVKAVRPS